MTAADGGVKLSRVLIVDASPDDAERALAALRHDGHPLKTTHRVANAPALKAAAVEDWDLVLCEARLGALTYDQVLAAVRTRRATTPFIVLAQHVDDDMLRRAFVSGASDVVAKGDWTRLACAARRASDIAVEREGYARTAESLRDLERRYRALVDHAREPIAYCHDGLHVDANPAYLTLFGYDDPEQLKLVPVLDLVAKHERDRLKALLRRPPSGRAEEFTALRCDGTAIPTELTLLPIEIDGQANVQINVTDISTRKALEHKLQQMRQHDALTGLFNRHYFAQALGKALEQAPVRGAVMGIELLELREMNRCFGHAACDRLLLMLGRELRSQLGESLLARVGGGQFAALLPEATATEAKSLASELDHHIRGLRVRESGQTLKYNHRVTWIELNPSVERHTLLATLFPEDERETATEPGEPAPASSFTEPVTPPALTPAAVIVPPVIEVMPDASESSEVSTSAEVLLQSALEHQGLQLWYQPIMNMYAEPRDFHELLLHAHNEDATVPAQLRDVKQHQLGAKIDRWQLQRAITHLGKLVRQGRHAAFFLRLSPGAIHDPGLLGAAHQHAKTIGVSSAHLFLQLDSALLASDGDVFASFVRQAKGAGFGVVLADFDATVQEKVAGLDVDFVRIDFATLGDIGVREALDAAKTLRRASIVDAVDSAEVFSILWECGADYVQGRYLQAASSELDYSFEGEQTLDSDRVPSGWQVRA